MTNLQNDWPYGAGVEPMTSIEYQRFYDCGEMPERFWPVEIFKLRDEFATGALTQQQFEDALDDLMGITNAH